MTLVKGTNCGFVSEAPSGAPAETGWATDGKARAFKDTSPAGAQKVTEIGWYCIEATEEANYEVAIYDHNVGDNNPEAIVGWDQTNAKGTDAGWKRCTGLDISITPETVYWIAMQLDETATTTRIDVATDAGEKEDVKTGQTELTDPWGVTPDTDPVLIAMYAVYEAGDNEANSRSGQLGRDTVLGEGNPEIRI